MRIIDLIFSDGRIEKCVTSEDGAVIHLVDYMENRFVINLSRAIVEFDDDDLGCNIHSFRLNKKIDDWLLELFDDDNERILYARFGSADVARGQGNGSNRRDR